MTTAAATGTNATPHGGVHARPAGFLRDLCSVAGRALRAVPREPEFMIPAIVVPVFFYFLNIGALEKVAEQGGVANFKAFQLPVAIVFAVTGISRASALVIDIQNGYFDRLLMTPIRRVALLLGLMLADFATVVALTVPVLLLGFVLGVNFETGVAGVVTFVIMGSLWGLAFTGFPYAIALKTGNPAAVNTSFILFFPFLFLTTAFLPKQALTGWLAAIATYNPVTYLLGGMRSLPSGWDVGAMSEGGAAILGIGMVSMTLALLALRGRVKRG
jgi:ABC-2 type transport system permease protein